MAACNAPIAGGIFLQCQINDPKMRPGPTLHDNRRSMDKPPRTVDEWITIMRLSGQCQMGVACDDGINQRHLGQRDDRVFHIRLGHCRSQSGMRKGDNQVATLHAEIFSSAPRSGQNVCYHDPVR